jgi:hypothetical protein
VIRKITLEVYLAEEDFRAVQAAARAAREDFPSKVGEAEMKAWLAERLRSDINLAKWRLRRG